MKKSFIKTVPLVVFIAFATVFIIFSSSPIKTVYCAENCVKVGDGLPYAEACTLGLCYCNGAWGGSEIKCEATFDPDDDCLESQSCTENPY